MSKIGIFILIGEPFRSGEQGTRIRGDKGAYQEQIDACKSHIEFMNHYSSIKWKVLIFTYTTPFDESIRNLYKPYHSSFLNDPIGYDALFEFSKQHLIRNQIKYDFIFVSRIDLKFKSEFKKIFNHKWNTIRYPFVCWKKDSTCKTYYPRVSDTMVYIPKKYNLSYITLNHDSWAELCERGLVYTDIDVMINTYHDSDSSKDINPLYVIVNRNKTKKWDSPNEIFDKKKQFIQTHKLFLAIGPTPYIISPYW